MGHNSPENFSKIGCSEAKIELGWGWGLNTLCEEEYSLRYSNKFVCFIKGKSGY
jgi:hypothetical protein